MDGDLVLAAAASSVSWKVGVAAAPGLGSAVWKHEDGKEKMLNDRMRCSTADEALRVIPLPARRGEGDCGCGCTRDDRAKMAATTRFRTTNHAAPEPSHAGRGQHHHSAAAIASGLGFGRRTNDSRDRVCFLCVALLSLR